MKIIYKDDYNTIEKDIKITNSIVESFMLYKKMDLSIKPFINETSLINSSEFYDWVLNEIVKPIILKDMNIELKTLYSAILKTYLEKELWNNEKELDKVFLTFKYSHKTKFNYDWTKIFKEFKKSYISVDDVDFVISLGGIRFYYENKLKELEESLKCNS